MTPSLRERYVTRAKYLKQDPAFREVIEKERGFWNDRFPAFAIRMPSYPPDSHREDGPGRIIYPPQLASAAQRLDAHLTPATWDAEERETAAIRDEWWKLCRRLAATWWPERHFPVWRTIAFDHPALPFISACLVYLLEMVPEEWIARDQALQVSRSSVDPQSDLDQRVQYWIAYAQTLEAALAEAADRSEALTAEQVTDARAAAEQAGRAAYRAHDPGDPQTWVHFVQLVPGMTTSDWRDLEKQVMAIHNRLYGTNPMAVLARRLRDKGYSDYRIARELGFSERHAARILEELNEG
jgi:hypothetical protein